MTAMTEPLRVKGGALLARRNTPDMRSPSYTNAAAAADGEKGSAIMMLQPAMHVPPVDAARAAITDCASARDAALASRFLWVQPSLVAL